jgi:hypothetical protein
MDKEGRLEFPASREDIRKYGATMRRVFIHDPHQFYKNPLLKWYPWEERMSTSK